MEIKNYAPGMIYLQDDQNVFSSDYSGAHPYIILGRYEDSKDYVEALHMVQCMSITTLKNRKVRSEIPILFNGRVKYIIPFNIFSFKLEYFKSPQLIKGCIMNSVGDTTEFINFLMEVYLATNHLLEVDDRKIREKYNNYCTWFFTEYKDYPNDGIVDLNEINNQKSFRERYFDLSLTSIFNSISIPEPVIETNEETEIIEPAIEANDTVKMSESMEESIIRLYTEDMETIASTAKKLNISLYHVRNVLRKNSLSRKRGRRRIAVKDIEKFNALKKNGMSNIELAKKFNVPISTVEDFISNQEKQNKEIISLRAEDIIIKEDLSEDVSKLSSDKLNAFSFLYKKRGAKYICSILKSDLCKVRNKITKIEKEINIRNKRGTFSPKYVLTV